MAKKRMAKRRMVRSEHKPRMILSFAEHHIVARQAQSLRLSVPDGMAIFKTPLEQLVDQIKSERPQH
jgi:hypothetical protein